MKVELWLFYICVLFYLCIEVYVIYAIKLLGHLVNLNVHHNTTQHNYVDVGYISTTQLCNMG